MPRRAIFNLLDDRRGVAAVEFAFVAPLMMALLLGVVEMGRMFLIHHALTFAADEAARAAMVRNAPTKAEIESVARNFAVGMEPDRTTVSVTFTTYPDGRYTDIAVTYQFSLMVAAFGVGDFTMQRTARVNRRNSF